MTDRPILFSGPMVRAILEGKKTQTRRLFKPRPPRGYNLACICGPGLTAVFNPAGTKHRGDPDADFAVRLPYQMRDRLWVRETWKRDGADSIAAATADFEDAMGPQLGPTFYAADAPPMGPSRYWPSIHMPRWASRLTLTVTDVRVQRLQDISEEDAEAEGVSRIRDNCYVIRGVDYDLVGLCHSRATIPFAKLWDSINGKREGASWDDNPWVVALTFTAENRNIDAVKAEDDSYNERLISAARLDPL